MSNISKEIGYFTTNSSGEEVTLEGYTKGKMAGRPCFLCEKPIILAESDENTVRTICDDCAKSEDAYSLYVLKFMERMGSV